MEELTINEIQHQALKVLRHVTSFCEEHNLNYSIAYGTLIGAVRHQGFIPWDDDIDIIMPRRDYEVFMDLYNDSKYRMIKGDGLSNHLHVVVSDPETIVKFKSPYDSFFYKGGVWVDIFPIDRVPSDKRQYERLRTRIKRICKLQHLAEISIARKNIMEATIFNLMHIMLHPFREKLGAYANRLMLQTKTETNTCANLSLWYLKYPPFPQKWLDSYSHLEFEGGQFMVISHYHDFLTEVYGDYMKLPPEEERIPRHAYKAFYKEIE